MVFAITRLVPGGPVERMMLEYQTKRTGSSGGVSGNRTQPLSDDQIDMLKKYYGFDKPIFTSYLIWLGKVLKGDLGGMCWSRCSHGGAWIDIRLMLGCGPLT